MSFSSDILTGSRDSVLARPRGRGLWNVSVLSKHMRRCHCIDSTYDREPKAAEIRGRGVTNRATAPLHKKEAVGIFTYAKVSGPVTGSDR